MRLSSGQLTALGMVAVIIGLAVWRLMNSTQTWWTIVVAGLAIIGVGVFVYYMMSGKKQDDDVDK
jgi:multisubunit Na+/H+ antiporter MnhC subunit